MNKETKDNRHNVRMTQETLDIVDGSKGNSFNSKNETTLSFGENSDPYLFISILNFVRSLLECILFFSLLFIIFKNLNNMVSTSEMYLHQFFIRILNLDNLLKSKIIFILVVIEVLSRIIIPKYLSYIENTEEITNQVKVLYFILIINAVMLFYGLHFQIMSIINYF